MHQLDIYQRTSLSADATNTGLEALEKLSRLGIEGNTSTFINLAQSIKTSTVDAALRLSLDPKTTRRLIKNGPAVMKGCVRLIRAAIVRDSNVAPAVSHECGYACFMLLVSTLNTCLLDRCNQLNQALKFYNTVTHTSLQVLLSASLSRAIETQVKISNVGGDCDSILGWPSSTGRSRLAPLLTRDDAMVLLNLLWDFRKELLKAMLSTSPPGLAGLMFLFLRSLRTQPSLRSQEWELIKCKLHELALRYMLLGEEHWDQHLFMDEILNQIDSSDRVWGMQSKYADVEDSRSILRAFIDVLSNHTRRTFPMNTPYILLRLIVMSVHFDSQDLLPEVMEGSIEYAWAMLIRVNGRVDMGPFVQGFFGSLKMLIIPIHNEPYQLTDTTQDQVINALHNTDVLDLVARVIAGLKPGPRISSPVSDRNDASLQHMFRFLAMVCEIVPEEQSADCFQDCVLDWLKFDNYMHINAFGLMPAQ
ncbi:hypothetical protein V565_193080, partial [Rhizoctonia solani 123E]